MNHLTQNNVEAQSQFSSTFPDLSDIDEPCFDGPDPITRFYSLDLAAQHDYRLKDDWTLADRKVISSAKPTARWVIREDRQVKASIPLYHKDQTSPSGIRERTKAYVHFKRLYGFSSAKHIEYAQDRTTGNWQWFTHYADRSQNFYHHRTIFDHRCIVSHINGTKIYGGYVDELTKVVISDMDFHDIWEIQPCLDAVDLL